jgi:signal transduction histidine kinase/CheY-like chemotaxis protein
VLGRRLRFRTILALLVLTITIPLAAFAAWLIRANWKQQQDVIDQQNIERARAISVAVDQELDRTITALNVLATLEAIQAADLSEFRQIALQSVPLHRGWESVRLLTPALEVVLDTATPTGEPPPLINPDWARKVIATKAAAISGLRRNPVNGHWVLSIGVPVTRNGSLMYVLGARLNATAFSDILKRQKLPPRGVVALLDATPVFIARNINEDTLVGTAPQAEDTLVGTAPQADVVERIRNQADGSRRGVTLEGVEAYSAWSRSPLTLWTAGLAVPSEPIDRPVRLTYYALTGAGAALVALGLVLALFLSRVIVRTQTAAAAAARALARGEPVQPFESQIAESHDLAEGLRDAATILQTRLQERDEAQRDADRHRTALFEREKTARRAAESLSRSKDEFVATMSHELRTPLNAIFGWVALLKTGTLEGPRQAHALDVIDRNTRAQAQLIEDLLDMSRVIRGTIRLDMRPVDLATILEAAVDSLRPTADARQIALRIVDAAPGIVVSADSGRMQQILWNLIANSLKFTPSGGRIEARAKIEGDTAVVRIADSGEGITPEFLPHVFDRFRQETSDVTREHSGLGIGLSLVRHLTELHGGTVAAESRGKRHGATFIVRVPLLGARSTRGAASPMAPIAVPRAGARVLEGLHVLAVDDDPDALDLLASLLRQAGARVTPASTAAEALGALDAAPIDTVVSDIAMSNGSGYDLVRALRADPRTSTVPIVAVTAHTREEDRARMLAEGFNAHIGKPFEPLTLVGLLQSLVRPRT